MTIYRWPNITSICQSNCSTTQKLWGPPIHPALATTRLDRGLETETAHHPDRPRYRAKKRWQQGRCTWTLCGESVAPHPHPHPLPVPCVPLALKDKAPLFQSPTACPTCGRRCIPSREKGRWFKYPKVYRSYGVRTRSHPRCSLSTSPRFACGSCLRMGFG
jgi:hypothetical protein